MYTEVSHYVVKFYWAITRPTVRWKFFMFGNFGNSEQGHKKKEIPHIERIKATESHLSSQLISSSK